MKISTFNVFQLLIMLLMFFVACSDDEGGDSAPTTAELLVGNWTTSATEITITVDGQSLVDYLVDVVGMSPTDATVYAAIYEAALEDEVSGTLTINSDNTYISQFGGGTDNGTWSLSADEKTLTLSEGADVIDITINSLSSDTFVGTLGDTFLEDLDGDAGTPDEEVMVEATVTMTK